MSQFPLNGSSARLLCDESMQSFIRDGYIVLKSELSAEFHAQMYAALDELEEGGPRGHNNLLPCVPELAILLDEPVIRGALTSILGPDYYLHFHRHDHFNFPNEAQPLHKDGDNHSHYAIDGLRRVNRTRYVMLFYYPQDTPLEKGPTGIVPRSQYVPRRGLETVRGQLHQFERRLRDELASEHANLSQAERLQMWQERRKQFFADNPKFLKSIQALDKPWEEAKIPILGDAGTVAIVHFDMVHGRYSGNTTDKNRHMVKFLFTRDREPSQPSWDHQGTSWPADENPQTPIWRSIWDWHRGQDPVPQQCDLPALNTQLDSNDDLTALGAAYTLGSHGPDDPTAHSALFERFLDSDVNKRTIAAYGLIEAGQSVVPKLLDLLESADDELRARIMDVLGDIGPSAASAKDALNDAVADENVNVRRYAIEALGTVGQGQSVDAESLKTSLKDEDALVRRNAALATARLAPDISNTSELVPLLADNLYHWHHHVRGWSIEALQRLNTSEANDVALRYLMSTRWDFRPKSGDTPPGFKPPKETIAASTN